MNPSRKIAVYPGSFDPITLGHLDILKRMAPSYEKLILLVSSNRSKTALFTPEDRVELAREALKGIPSVTVEMHQGLTVDFVRKVGAGVILRGLRAVTDFEYELVMANMNKQLAPEIETVIVFASPEFYYLSSNTVKEVALHGGPVADFVPPNVQKALQAKASKK